MNKTFRQDLLRKKGSVELSVIRALINNPNEASHQLESLIDNRGLKKVAGLYLEAKQSGKAHSTSFFLERVNELFVGDADAEQKVRHLFSGEYTSSDLSTFVSELKSIAATIEVERLSVKFHDDLLAGTELTELCQISSAIVEIGREQSLGMIRQSVNVGDAMDNTICRFQDARASQVKLGLPFHLTKLNEAVKGFYPKDLIILGARPSVGKTAFALNAMASCEAGKFGIFSTEMSEEQLCIRFISMMTGISGDRMREPSELTDDEFERACTAAAKFKSKDIQIDDTGRITIEQLEQRLRYWVKVFGVQVVVVDYIQRIHTERYMEDSKRIAYVTQTLKELAKELGITILGLAQLNRDVGKEDRRPSMRDLRGCGEMEQEADVIILLHSPVFGTSASNGLHPMELIVDKNRHGRVGIVLSMFDPTYMSYRNPTPEQYAAYLEATD